MADKINMSLEDIIKCTGSSHRRGESCKSNFRRTKQVYGGIAKPCTERKLNNCRKQNLSVVTVERSNQSNFDHTKLIISNLDSTVSDSDIQGLFTQFGPIHNAAVHYSQFGRSLGSGEVTFIRRRDAIKAMKQYNGAPLDGRSLNIQLVISDIPFPNCGREANSFQNGNQAQWGHPGGGKNRKVPVSTVEELDAELDAYSNERKKIAQGVQF